jgi:hypothetical protein
MILGKSYVLKPIDPLPKYLSKTGFCKTPEELLTGEIRCIDLTKAGTVRLLKRAVQRCFLYCQHEP